MRPKKTQKTKYIMSLSGFLVDVTISFSIKHAV